MLILGRLIRKFSTSERGSSMAWTAIFLSFVVIPLLTLLVDGARLLYVQGRLQSAADAACEDAAWSGADRRAFRNDGETTFEKDWYVLAVAQSTFNQILSEQEAKHYGANLLIRFDSSDAVVSRSAAANVPLVTTGGLIWSPIAIQVQSAAMIRLLWAFDHFFRCLLSPMICIFSIVRIS